jgi:hypothetical protein
MATAKTSKSAFEKLRDVNVNERTEKKGGMTYLTWAWAWAEAKKLYPNLQRTVYKNEHGWNYHTDGKSGWVEVGVTIDKLEYIDYLPIMDFRNKSVPLEKITSFDVNKAIQRSTTKALALHGLGLYIYAGEDLPEVEATASKSENVSTHFSLDIGDENWSKVLKYVSANKGLGFEKILTNLKKKYDIKAPIKKEISKLVNK